MTIFPKPAVWFALRKAILFLLCFAKTSSGPPWAEHFIEGYALETEWRAFPIERQRFLGEGSDEYRKPAEFFRRTYLTGSLKNLLVNNPSEQYLVSFTTGSAVYAASDSRVIPALTASFSSRGPNGFGR